MATLAGSGSHTPDLLLIYHIERSSRSVVDVDLVGDVAMQLRPAGPRRGKLAALFLADESAALDLADEIATGEVVTITGSGRTGLDLPFILADGGTVEVELDDVTREDFIVSWDFVEVPA